MRLNRINEWSGKALRVLGPLVVAGLVAEAIAHAAIPDQNGVLHGCYQDRGFGQLRVIDPSKGQRCLPAERPISWNVQGIPGPQGPPGPPGPTFGETSYLQQATLPGCTETHIQTLYLDVARPSRILIDAHMSFVGNGGTLHGATLHVYLQDETGQTELANLFGQGSGDLDGAATEIVPISLNEVAAGVNGPVVLTPGRYRLRMTAGALNGACPGNVSFASFNTLTYTLLGTQP